MKLLHCALSAFLATVLTGCGNPTPSAPPQSSANPPANSAPPAAPQQKPAAKAESSEPHYHLDHAQAKLPTVKLRLSTKTLEAELCTTLEQVATGLMYRPGIGPEEGMLFVFGAASRRAFYMKNVDFDISVAYIDSEGVIREIVTLRKRDETAVPSQSDNIQFVLETATDWFTRNGIGVGTLIQTEQGGLRETLAHRAQLR